MVREKPLSTEERRGKQNRMPRLASSPTSPKKEKGGPRLKITLTMEGGKEK